MEKSLDFRINDLISRAKAGDDDAFSELVSQYKPMLTSAASRLGLSPDEYFSDACIGLYRAILTYDTAKSGVTFGLYASVCVRHRLSDAIRKERAAADKLPVTCEVDVDSIAVPDASLTALIEREESRSLKTEAKEILSDLEYRVFGLWLLGFSGADIVRELSIDLKSVENAKGRIMKKLRQAFNPR